MKIAIVDDSIKDREYLQKEIQEIFFRRTKNHIEITTFKSGEELLEYFYDNKEGNASLFDIVFLDIYMEDITGVDTARAIRKIDEDVKPIFITTSNEFASESYEVKAEDYLIKPFNKERLEKNFRETCDKEEKERQDIKVFRKQSGSCRFYCLYNIFRALCYHIFKRRNINSSSLYSEKFRKANRTFSAAHIFI